MLTEMQGTSSPGRAGMRHKDFIYKSLKASMAGFQGAGCLDSRGLIFAENVVVVEGFEAELVLFFFGSKPLEGGLELAGLA